MTQSNEPVDMQALIRLIESNAKAIEAGASQQAIDREQARLDRELARQSREEYLQDIGELRKLIDSNAKAIESAGNQQAADRDLARADRERSRVARDQMMEFSRQTTEEIRALAALVRESHENSKIQEREIRIQSGEIQNLADSIQYLYSRQPPPSS
jgi:hypothetical protein